MTSSSRWTRSLTSSDLAWSAPARGAALILLGVSLLALAGAAACVPLEDLGDYSRGAGAARAPAPSEPVVVPSAPMPVPAATAGPASDELPIPTDVEQPAPVLTLPLPTGAPSESAVSSTAAEQLDAGRLPASSEGQPTVDASVPPTLQSCAGSMLADVCWYLGTPGASCERTCEPHGGYRDGATSFVGTSAQGGSAERCNAVLAVLGVTRSVRTIARADGRGVGCHFFGTEDDPWWLTEPDFTPWTRLEQARLVCGCNA